MEIKELIAKAIEFTEGYSMNTIYYPPFFSAIMRLSINLWIEWKNIIIIIILSSPDHEKVMMFNTKRNF